MWSGFNSSLEEFSRMCQTELTVEQLSGHSVIMPFLLLWDGTIGTTMGRSGFCPSRSHMERKSFRQRTMASSPLLGGFPLQPRSVGSASPDLGTDSPLLGAQFGPTKTSTFMSVLHSGINYHGQLCLVFKQIVTGYLYWLIMQALPFLFIASLHLF